MVALLAIAGVTAAIAADTADALTAYNPELVIVRGVPVAISDAVANQVSAATELPTVDPSPTPTTGVVRAAGDDRFQTATIVADLLTAYTPAHLSVDAQAVDADLLDGMDSTEFLTDADAGAFEPAGSAPLLFSDEASSSLTFTDADAHVVQSLMRPSLSAESWS